MTSPIARLERHVGGLLRRARALTSEPGFLASSAVALVTLAVTVRVFLLYNDGFLHAEPGYDETFFTWGGWCILKGLVPYRDFIEYKPPMLFLTHALSLKLLGFGQLKFRYFFAWFPLVSLLALQVSMMTRRIEKLSALALVLAIVSLWVTSNYHDTALSDAESIGLSYYFLGVAFLIARTPFRGATNAIGTAFLLCAALSKEPYAPCAGATWACCFLLGERTSDRRADAVRYLKSSSLGAGVVVLGLLIYMLPTGALTAYAAATRRYFGAYGGNPNGYCVSQGRFTPASPPAPFKDFLALLEIVRKEFYNLGTFGFLAPIAAAAVVFIPRRSVILFLASGLACCLAAWAPMIGNCHWTHYYNLAFGGMFFILVVGLDAMSLRVRERTVRWFVGFAFLGSVLAHMWPRIESERLAYGTRTFADPYHEPVPGVFQAVADHTTPSDRIFTTGVPSLYVQTDRISAVRESGFIDPSMSFYRGDDDASKLQFIRDQLERNMPKIVVLDPEHGWMKPRHNSVLMMPFLSEHHYEKLTDLVWLRPDSPSRARQGGREGGGEGGGAKP